MKLSRSELRRLIESAINEQPLMDKTVDDFDADYASSGGKLEAGDKPLEGKYGAVFSDKAVLVQDPKSVKVRHVISESFPRKHPIKISPVSPYGNDTPAVVYHRIELNPGYDREIMIEGTVPFAVENRGGPANNNPSKNSNGEYQIILTKDMQATKSLAGDVFNNRELPKIVEFGRPGSGITRLSIYVEHSGEGEIRVFPQHHMSRQ